MSPKKKKKQNIIFIVHPPHTCHKIITNIGHLFKAQSAFEKETSIWRSRKNSWYVCGYRCSLRGSSTDNPYLYQLHNCFVAILHFLLLWWNQQSLRLKNLNCQKPKPKISFRIRIRIASRVFSEMATPSEDHFERVNSSQILICVYFCCEKPSDLILLFFWKCKSQRQMSKCLIWDIFELNNCSSARHPPPWRSWTPWQKPRRTHQTGFWTK